MLCMSPTHSGGFVSGGADGVVRVWDENIAAKGASFDIGQASAREEVFRDGWPRNDCFRFPKGALGTGVGDRRPHASEGVAHASLL